MGWSYEWVKNLVLSDNFEVYPLQFANTKRIEFNDAVYIFDEVGCGKTISAGLMALNYLYNAENKNVCIVTINSLVRPTIDSSNGQFLNDWYDKLPFMTFGWNTNIFVCNNHYKNISKIQETGLLIVDEAQLFLEDTERLAALKNIKAEKVIFLTATPIKHSETDLYKYVDMAECILQKKCKADWIPALLGEEKEGKKFVPICSDFHINSPVTRYFKDTVTALQYVDDTGEIDFEKEKAKRLIPQIWNYNAGEADGKTTSLIDKILSIPYDEDGNKNRFVIFTRYVSKESDVIEKKLLERDEFVKWNGSSQEGKLSVVNINGQTSERATSYSHNGTQRDLPDVMIITYQIAEQGINLPGYSYVINYHISAFPSSLEQRFGRIDRMGKKNPTQYKVINMVFLLSEHGWESYKQNFYMAVSIYRYNLISKIPAKNVILTKEILSRCNHDRGIIDNYLNEILELSNTEESINKTYDYLCSCNKKDQSRREGEYEEEARNQKEEEYPEDELTKFCLENDIVLYAQYGENAEVAEDTIEDLRSSIKEKVHYLKSYLNIKAGEKNEDKMDDILKRIGVGDKVYFFKNEDISQLVTIEAIGDSAKQIYMTEEYKIYEAEFNKTIKLPKVIAKNADKLETYFEMQFISGNGKFENIFRTDYTSFMKEITSGEAWGDVRETDKKLLCENAKIVIRALPFFRMIDEYQRIIFNYCWTKAGYLRRNWDFDLLLSAYNLLEYKGMIPETLLKDMDDKKTVCNYRENNPHANYEKFPYYVDEDENNYECSNWFKLFAYCMDRDNFQYYIAIIEEFQSLAKHTDALWQKLQDDYYRAETVAYDGEDDEEVAKHLKYDILSNESTPYYDSIEELLLSQETDRMDLLAELIGRVCWNNKHDLEYGCYERVTLFYVFFGEGLIDGWKSQWQDGIEKTWRSPYKSRMWETKRWSPYLPRESAGRGYRQIWYPKDARKCDLWTYIIFSEIGGDAVKPLRTLYYDWWVDHFIPDRCFAGYESERAILDYLKEKLK